MFVETFPVSSVIRWLFKLQPVGLKRAAETKGCTAHPPSKMNSDDLIRLNLRSPNPHAPSAALEVSVFAASPNPGFCAPAVSLRAVRMNECILFSLQCLWRKEGLMAGWNFSFWFVISEVARDYMFVWVSIRHLSPLVGTVYTFGWDFHRG